VRVFLLLSCVEIRADLTVVPGEPGAAIGMANLRDMGSLSHLCSLVAPYCPACGKHRVKSAAGRDGRMVSRIVEIEGIYNKSIIEV